MIIDKVTIANKNIFKPMVTINNEDFDTNIVLNCIKDLKQTIGYSSYTSTFHNIEEYKIYRFLVDNNIAYIVKQDPDERSKESYYTDTKGEAELTELEEYINLRLQVLNSNVVISGPTRAEEIEDLGKSYNIDFPEELTKSILKWAREDAEVMLECTLDHLKQDIEESDLFDKTNDNIVKLSEFIDNFYIKTVMNDIRTQYDKPNKSE